MVAKGGAVILISFQKKKKSHEEKQDMGGYKENKNWSILRVRGLVFHGASWPISSFWLNGERKHSRTTPQNKDKHFP